MSGIAANRLREERSQWRKDHPFGFHAKPIKKADDSLDLFRWDCGIPGKEGSVWEGSIYPLTMSFTEDYPMKPPKCAFPEGFYHPNVFPSGTVCLSILSEDQDWKPSMGIRQILLGIQDLLDNPNSKSPAQAPAYQTFVNDRKSYLKKVKDQALRYRHLQDATSSSLP